MEYGKDRKGRRVSHGEDSSGGNRRWTDLAPRDSIVCPLSTNALRLSMFLLLIDSCVSLRVFLPLTLEGEAQDTHFGLLLLSLIFCLLAGVTFDPKLNFL